MAGTPEEDRSRSRYHSGEVPELVLHDWVSRAAIRLGMLLTTHVDPARTMPREPAG
jgi:hypothetical protein